MYGFRGVVGFASFQPLAFAIDLQSPGLLPRGVGDYFKACFKLSADPCLSRIVFGPFLYPSLLVARPRVKRVATVCLFS